MKAITTALFLLVVVHGCGPGKALQPLHGESAAIADLMETPQEVLQDTAPYQQANQLLNAIRTGTDLDILSSLSNATVRGLLAANGATPEKNLPLTEAISPYTEKRGQLERILFGIPVERIGIPTPRELTKEQVIPHAHRANVRIISTSKTEHWATFIYESGTWRLHQPEFK